MQKTVLIAADTVSWSSFSAWKSMREYMTSVPLRTGTGNRSGSYGLVSKAFSKELLDLQAHLIMANNRWRLFEGAETATKSACVKMDPGRLSFLSCAFASGAVIQGCFYRLS